MEHEDENLAATLAREMKTPIEVLKGDTPDVRRIALPEGWSVEGFDDEAYRPAPRRKIGTVVLSDVPSFVSYVKRHGSLDNCTVWCKADYAGGIIKFTAIINDHGEEPNAQQWRDHRANFAPVFSEEWKRWTLKNTKPFNQFDFACFIEENNKDIAPVAGGPTGAQMLEMAVSMEANQDVRFKSAIRLQNGGVSLNYVADDDAQTITKMQLFERFSLGIPVFLGGDAYQVDARLRYRVREQKLTFWYELIRPDKLLEAAASTMVNAIQGQVGMPFFFGEV